MDLGPGFSISWNGLCERVRVKVLDLGFGPFLSIPLLKADKALLMALAERWSPDHPHLHLPTGEIGVTLTDFYMMTRLPVGGVPLRMR